MAGDLPPGIIEIVNGSGRAPKHSAHGPPPPPPAPPAPPMAANSQQYHAIGQHPSAPVVVMQPGIQPSSQLVQMQARERPAVTYRDIRPERVSESDAREKLSSWVVLRFEKIIDEEFNEVGYPILPTWENVIRVEEKDIDKHEAARRVHELDRTTKSVSEKKASLNPAQQRQLEAAQEDLQNSEVDQRYHFVLEQIDHQLKQLDRREIEYYERYGQLRDPTKPIVSRRQSSSVKRSSSVKSRKKRLYERISLTAYFKRTPKPTEKALSMLQERDFLAQQKALMQGRELAHQLKLQQEAQLRHQQQLLHQHQQHYHQQHGNHHQKPPVPPAQPIAANRRQHAPVIEIVAKGKKGSKVYRTGPGSPRSSRSSGFSEESWSTDESIDTSNTSLVSSETRSSRRHGRRRSRSRHRRHEHPQQYGIETPRQHLRREQHFIMDAFPRRMPDVPMPPSPPVALPAIDVEAVREEAYHMGRLDERVQTETRALDEVVCRPRTALPPRIIQRRSSVRFVDPHEAVRERHEDALERLDRLQLDEEIRYEDQLRYEEEMEAEERGQEFRRREALATRLRRQRADLDMFDFDEEPAWQPRSRGYLPRPETERDPRGQFANPFTPLAARGRRHSTAFS